MTKIFAALLLLTLAMPAMAGFRGFDDTNGDLQVLTSIQCSTGTLCTRVGSKLKITSVSTSLAFPFTESFSNSADGVVDLISDNTDAVFKVKGFENKSASLALWADEGDDAADKYTLKVDTSDVLHIMNDVTDLMLMSSAGVITYADGETFTDSSDIITWAWDDAPAEMRLKAFEGGDSKLVLQADESDDVGDDWEIKSQASDQAFVISNDTSGAQVAKFSMTPAGNVSMVGSLTGDGGDSVSGFLEKVVSATATTITAAQCGSTFQNTGAVVINLPEASTVIGCRLTFIVGNASNFDVNPDNADQILFLTNAVGDATRASALGAAVTLQAIDATNWSPIAQTPGSTWSDVN